MFGCCCTTRPPSEFGDPLILSAQPCWGTGAVNPSPVSGIAEWRDNASHYVSFNDWKIFYKDSLASSPPSAKVVLLLHGFPTRSILRIPYSCMDVTKLETYLKIPSNISVVSTLLSSWDWAPCWLEMSSRYRLIAVDLLGLYVAHPPQP